ncbi:MAG: proteasome accessory factor PafA2 family protein [Actinomycetaceae bacterium]|nr:proteasome accessory factor PafA2 family protein [Actinomycetaceae bacterium]
MKRRVFGIETEYGIACVGPQGAKPPLDAEHAARELFTPVLARHRSTNVFTVNGGRLYLDVGAHPEYATAECSTIRELIAQDAAGSRILASLAAQATRRMRERGVGGRIHVFKNNVDAVGNSCGCHENYLVKRSPQFRAMADALVSFFVARSALVGAGWVAPDGSYHLTQRAQAIDDEISAATTRTRPIINTRDEPLADASAYRRLHVIVGDSSVSQATTMLKIGSTCRMLTAVERGIDISDLCLAQPLRTLRELSRDPSLKTPVELRDGRRLTIPQLLEIYRERVLNLECDDELDLRVMDLWARGNEALATQQWGPIETELDFAIKYRLLQRASARAARSLTKAEQTRLELAYHDITDASLAPSLAAAGALTSVVTDAEVEQARHRAPTTTRAHLRARVLAAAKEHGRDVSVDWLHIRLNDSRRPTLTLADPLASDNPDVEALIADMEDQQ